MASYSLERLIENTYNGHNGRRRYYYNEELPEAKIKILEVPCENLEIPVCCGSLVNPEVYSIISVRLKVGVGKSSYTSFDAAFRDVFTMESKEDIKILKKMTIKKKEVSYNYYVGNGIIMDEDKVLAMLSWKESMDTVAIGGRVPRLEAPILRISPFCFMNLDPPMHRFLSSKFITAALHSRVEHYDAQGMWHAAAPKIVIEPCPFKFRQITLPDVLTTNKKLLNPLLNHIEEIIP